MSDSVHKGGRFDFSGLAEVYDRWYASKTGRAYDIAEKRAVGKLLPGPYERPRLLEVGCGTGHWSQWFAARRFDVVGVDISPEMIAVARNKKIDGASFETADARALPFENGAFNVAVAITSLEFVADVETMLNEMARCARKPGGALIVGALNSLAPLNAKRIADGEPPYADARLFSPDELKDLLASFGEPEITTAAFLPNNERLLALAALYELVGRVFRPGKGVFIAGKVVL